MSYLFGFSGRINRARMWLFFLVTLVWEMVIGAVAAAGLQWTAFLQGRASVNTVHLPAALGHFEVPLPDPIKGAGWIALGVIAVLFALYVVALLAVYTKRLHDRNRSAWWLIPFLAIPWGLAVLDCTGASRIFAMEPYFGPMGIGEDTAGLIGAVFGLWAFIELLFLRGTVGGNPYGPDPLA
ncbi:MAG: DUF805 domain-containing protein [Alphaproteobacteria bacterium]|nr:DUF805 domain-containing protein [Alphaproteobacteria bacterium]